MTNRRERFAGQLGAFIQQYGRPAAPGNDPNERRYDREVERRVKRMDPEELDALMRGEDLGEQQSPDLGSRQAW